MLDIKRELNLMTCKHGDIKMDSLIYLEHNQKCFITHTKSPAIYIKTHNLKKYPAIYKKNTRVKNKDTSKTRKGKKKVGTGKKKKRIII